MQIYKVSLYGKFNVFNLAMRLTFTLLLCFSPAINPCGSIEVEETKWRPLVIEVGPLGCLTGIGKIAASVIAPLADRGISVFCLSTNQDDYVMVSIWR